MTSFSPKDISLLTGGTLRPGGVTNVEKMGMDLRGLQGEGSKESKIRRVAVQFEEMLISTLLKHAYPQEKNNDGQEMALSFGNVRDFRVMLMSQHIADNGGLGYQQVIEEQIRERFFPGQDNQNGKTPGNAPEPASLKPLSPLKRDIRTINGRQIVVPPPPDPEQAYAPPTRPANHYLHAGHPVPQNSNRSNRSNQSHPHNHHNHDHHNHDHHNFVSPVKSAISSDFGWRRDPIDGKTRFHNGIDYSVPPHTPVKSCMDGQVVFSGWEAGYGRLVEIKHDNGYTSRYGHNAKLMVKKGDIVKAGTVIAKSGSSGRSTGPHLHFEVRKDNLALDPTRFLRQNNKENILEKKIQQNTNVIANNAEIEDVGL